MGCEQSSSRPHVLNNHATINGASGIHPLKPESGSHISKLGKISFPFHFLREVRGRK